MYFFVHIPKTAGTSFRTAAERFFGSDKVVYDYGADSPVTSACIARFLYAAEREDKAGLYRHWQQAGTELVAGHKPANRYLDHVGLPGVLTFVREPLERSFSEFLHFRREKGFEGTFRDFFEQQPANHQSRMFANIPASALGFVGVTERYGDSLRLLNEHYGWQIRKRRVNRARLLDPRPSSIRSLDRKDFYTGNQDDVALYRYALASLEQRLELHRRGLAYVHGGFDKMKRGKVAGWAWWADGRDEPVEIEISSGTGVIQRLTAEQPHKSMKRHGAPRDGRVGFAADFDVDLPGDVEFRVAATGQSLFGRTPLSGPTR